MRVLVLEDEQALREQLAERLRAAGYAVDVAANGEDGEFVGLEYPIDAAVVDLGLPDKPGTAVIETWRARGKAFPVLILTARGRWEDKVAGLEIGADDYLVKPFHNEELLARLRALLRRAAGFSQSRIECGPIVMDLGGKQVTIDGRELELTALEYKVLECLMLRAGNVLSKGELTEHVYEEDAERDSNVLEVIIGRLRKKLDPKRLLNPIETIRGQGYRLRLPRTPADG
ncbi:MAG: response regulator transcription factor [Gammaproteobacteria bacterium]|nr:response regulator transcription factor [Gammaproteobacteria bacterium]